MLTYSLAGVNSYQPQRTLKGTFLLEQTKYGLLGVLSDHGHSAELTHTHTHTHTHSHSFLNDLDSKTSLLPPYVLFMAKKPQIPWPPFHISLHAVKGLC